VRKVKRKENRPNDMKVIGIDSEKQKPFAAFAFFLCGLCVKNYQEGMISGSRTKNQDKR